MKVTLEELLEDYKGIQLAKKYLVNLEKRLKEDSVKLNLLHEKCVKEQIDVIKEQFSLRAIFSKVLQNEHKQFEKEKQEYLVAALEYNEFYKKVELIKYEIDVLKEKIAKEEKISTQLSASIKNRNKEIAEKYPNIKDDLMAFHYQLEQQISYKKEITEALSVAEKVASRLEQMQTILLFKEEGNKILWGYEAKEINSSIDIKINQAHELAYIAISLLDQLESEMSDIFKIADQQNKNSLEEFKNFNKIYFNNLILDWLTQRKLANVVAHIDSTKNMITRLTNSLNVQLTKTVHSIAYINGRIVQTIQDKFSE